ncbi:MAG: diguanylate cyclase [Planctomycetes bacterium]|nr:diguanylate cyclase [Planctomycetota bacterium]
MGNLTKVYQVLIVDDEPGNLDLLSRRLLRSGYSVAIACSAAEAEPVVATHPPDIILLDIMMPEVSGLEYLCRLRADARTSRTPIIMVSALADTENIVTAISDGANDYVTKPINLPVLLARMQTHLKMAALVQNLETQTQLLTKLAAVDHLTGVYNRRSMFEALEVEMSRSRRSGRALSFVMLDIDHFKRLNDEHGHPVGDQVLREFAARAREAVRPTDLVCRYGGEEFAVILPETEATQAEAAGERVRQAIGGWPFAVAGRQIPVTVSVGLASVAATYSGDLARVIARADKALYEAKQSGRNRVCVAEAESIVGAPGVSGHV